MTNRKRLITSIFRSLDCKDVCLADYGKHVHSVGCVKAWLCWICPAYKVSLPVQDAPSWQQIPGIQHARITELINRGLKKNFADVRLKETALWRGVTGSVPSKLQRVTYFKQKIQSCLGGQWAEARWSSLLVLHDEYFMSWQLSQKNKRENNCSK